MPGGSHHRSLPEAAVGCGKNRTVVANEEEDLCYSVLRSGI
jgi:hypothetical protein